MRKWQILCLSSILICSFFLTGCMGGESKFESEIKKNNYGNAIKVYEKSIYGNRENEQKACDFMLEYLGNTLEDYANRKTSEDDVLLIMDTLCNVNDVAQLMNEELDEAQMFFESVTESRACYESGLSYLSDGEYYDALCQFYYVSDDDYADFDDAQSNFSEASNLYVQQLTDEITSYSDSGDYEYAIYMIDQVADELDAVDDHGGLEALDQLYTAVYTARFESIFSYYVQAEDYASAIYAYRNADDYVVISEQMQQQIDQCCDLYVEETKRNALEKYQADDFQGAFDTVNSALSLLSDNSELERVLGLYQNGLPVDILTFEYTYGGDRQIGEGFDVKQTPIILSDNQTHSGYVKFDAYQYNPSPYYSIKLNGEYDLFTGIIDTVDGDSTSYARIIIRADGEEVYNSGNLYRGADNIEFSIDVSGVTTIAIQEITDYGSAGSDLWFGTHPPAFYIYDSYVRKALNEDELK